jgi:DNA mismatch repair protein MutL
VLRSVRDALRGADLTPQVGAGFGGFESRAILPQQHGRGEGATPVVTNQPASRLGGFVDSFKRDIRTEARGNISYDAIRAAVAAPVAPPPPPDPGALPTNDSGGEAGAPLPIAVPAQRVLQVHNSYLVTQDEHGVVIVDQHALHERVMFEALIARVREAPLESQRLLTPAVVPATEQQLARLGDLAPLLSRIGVEAEPIGPRALAVHAFPTFLFDRAVEPVEFLGEILERADADGFAPGSEAAMSEVLDMMACKAAVKAGDRMSETELLELMRLREEVERSSNCPHGRPTTVRLTIQQLEKLFGRT